jgi:hypothetical protein
MEERSPVAGKSTPSFSSLVEDAVVVPLLVAVVAVGLDVEVVFSGWQATIQILVAMLNRAINKIETKRLVMF